MIGGQVKPDTRVGRSLAEAVASVPDMSPADFQLSLDKGLQDLLMVRPPAPPPACPLTPLPHAPLRQPRRRPVLTDMHAAMSCHARTRGWCPDAHARAQVHYLGAITQAQISFWQKLQSL
mgnify:CR=1 FL=1